MIQRWDIFCRIVDNFGDIGVCWRLARQLSQEYGIHVRLWVDDIPVAQRLLPGLDAGLPQQQLEGVTIACWDNDFICDSVAEVVIEAFACELPASYIQAMVATPPVWINLDYLSAETWVEEYHQQPSPHPRLPLKKTFFFPGFTERTGGLLREHDLLTQRKQYQLSLQQLQPTTDHTSALRVSLFAYPQADIATLLTGMAASERPVQCLIPESSLLQPVSHFFGKSRLCVGDSLTQGALTVEVLPFLSQPDYDRLLWSCDLNFVRGEDSWIRAIWAGKPFIWQPYLQEEDAHIIKLEAFLGRYLSGLDTETASTWSAFHHAWAHMQLASGDWPQLLKILPAAQAHTICQAQSLAEQADMTTQLVNFVRNFQ
ncbi:conserved hypothetical protein, PP_1857 family [Methylobacillus rhizosphaerae]|uniref:Protein-arginine rhamnosyltransferase n=1 Tax=Methylobacillus rhizosphaerae TaxID=551994 RepID=A0A238YEI4_9PROT|nr:elongation factor P maturation arginine rhamnosyltransferase EarP [Methylobacillus rhizosphaerae]SNR69696.1 conserved hypothetical protein, PP_1857 family [Methylobacillus rhizosphaerae]